MLEIKLTTTATATATAATTNSTTATTTTMYTIKDAGTCTLTQHLLVFRRKLHLHPVCWLRNRLFLIWLVWTGLQFCTDLCSSDHCWGKCNLVIPLPFTHEKHQLQGSIWCCGTTHPLDYQLFINIYAPLVVLGTWDNRKWWQKMLQMTALSVEHGWHAPTGILTWYKLVWLHLPCLAQTAVLVRVNGSCIGQVIISLFFSIFSLLQECFLVISVWCLKKKPSFPRPYITSAVHVITRSLKEYTGFTEIPGRLRTAHLLGQMTLFLKAPMVLPHVCHHEC